MNGLATPEAALDLPRRLYKDPATPNAKGRRFFRAT